MSHYFMHWKKMIYFFTAKITTHKSDFLLVYKKKGSLKSLCQSLWNMDDGSMIYKLY